MKGIYLYPLVDIDTGFKRQGKPVIWETHTKLIVLNTDGFSFEVKPAGRGFKNTLSVSYHLLSIRTPDGDRERLDVNECVADILLFLMKQK